jgi:hemerythrin-like domain-containing protein
MTRISEFLTHQHTRCDTHFAEAETAVAEARWDRAIAAFQTFRKDTLHHFDLEEGRVFPAFEARTGMVGGPTAVMRAEHQQLRDMLQAMGQALNNRDSEAYLGLSETLLMLMRQHNLKEENILYPMLDQVLDGDEAALLDDPAPIQSA